MLIYTCNRCCPTERYIRTVRIPGDLCTSQKFTNYLQMAAKNLQTISK